MRSSVYRHILQGVIIIEYGTMYHIVGTTRQKQYGNNTYHPIAPKAFESQRLETEWLGSQLSYQLDCPDCPSGKSYNPRFG